MKKLMFLLITGFTSTICFAYKYSCPKAFANYHSLNTTPPRSKVTVKKQIPIMAFVGVPQDKGTLARYQEMRNAGITLSYIPFLKADDVGPALDMAQKMGIKLFVACPEIITDPETTVKRFMHHPALAGYYLKDEPGKKDFLNLGILVDKIKTIDKQHICYINLFPNYADANALGTASYQEYLDSFVKEVPVQMLSFDHYPIVGKTIQSVNANWYNNLEMVSKKARNADKPFWAFALTTAFLAYPIPTLATIRLQVYSDLAYGAQGIQYFTYWTLTDAATGFNNAPINTDGNQTSVYQPVQQMSKEIKSLSAVFSGAKVISLTHTGSSIPAGTTPFTQLPKPVKMLQTDGIGAIVSVMKNGGNTFLVIVNRDFTADMNLKIKCSSGMKRVFKNGSSIAQHSTVSEVKIEPGDLAIYKWANTLN